MVGNFRIGKKLKNYEVRVTVLRMGREVAI